MILSLCLRRRSRQHQAEQKESNSMLIGNRWPYILMRFSSSSKLLGFSNHFHSVIAPSFSPIPKFPSSITVTMSTVSTQNDTVTHKTHQPLQVLQIPLLLLPNINFFAYASLYIINYKSPLFLTHISFSITQVCLISFFLVCFGNTFSAIGRRSCIDLIVNFLWEDVTEVNMYFKNCFQLSK